MQLIIFDLGGILVPEATEKQIYPEIAKELNITVEEFNEAVKDFKPMVTEGFLTLKEMYTKIITKFKLKITPEKVLEKHKELYIKYSTKRDEEIITLIEKLKINYEVVCLTNTETEIAEYNKEHGLFQYFEKAFLSCEMKIKKPNPEIYKKICQECNCASEEALFIDDNEEYTDGAVEAGLNVILFHNKKQLMKDLETLGILF
ncbi:MAG: HAD-IA family hydrolase [Candidatus Woesearchaeota archaeon]|jgi:putative hydrolase of the HAD superfamily